VKSGRPATVWQALGWAAAAIACIAYAVLAHHAASAPQPGLFEAAVFIVPLMAVALVPAWRSPHRAWWLGLWLAACGALWLARDLLGAGTQWVLLLQHVGINALLCIGFGRTLAPGAVPLVSRLARIVHGELSPRLVRYTRKATLAWTLFFGLNAAVSVLLFAAAPAAVWSGFVNLLSMPLLGAMFAGEYLVRMVVIPREERSGFLQSVQAYREFSRRDGAGPR
jgi:uncharacterized membrane protein